MEFADSISDQKVIQTLNRSHFLAKVKRAKTAQGQSHTEAQISNSTVFRNANDEMFLLDSGVGVNIFGEDIAIDYNIKMHILKQKRLVTEASGNLLNIIGSCEIFVKIPFIKTVKTLECLVLRGNNVDREILVCCDTLKKLDLIHSTFGRETVTNYFINNSTHYNISNSRLIRNKIKNVNNLSQLYHKYRILTDYLLGKILSECIKLREKILKIHKRNFKEKLGPTDRINHPPVKLQIDKSRGIKPAKHSKAYKIPIHLRESAQAEFTEMRKAGII